MNWIYLKGYFNRKMYLSSLAKYSTPDYAKVSTGPTQSSIDHKRVFSAPRTNVYSLD